VGLRTSIGVIAAGLVLLLAVTIQTTYVHLRLAGWALLLGGAAGLVISFIAQLRRVPYYPWFGSGPWLLAVGFAGWLALQPPNTPGIDLQMVGFILFVLGVCLSLAAIYVVSSFRLGPTMREYWRRPTTVDDDPTALRRPYDPRPYDPQPPTKRLPRP
jgi:hypothetical protein